MSSREELEDNVVKALSSVLREDFRVNDSEDFISLLTIINQFYVNEMGVCYAMTSGNMVEAALEKFAKDKEAWFENLEESVLEAIEEECESMAKLQAGIEKEAEGAASH